MLLQKHRIKAWKRKKKKNKIIQSYCRRGRHSKGVQSSFLLKNNPMLTVFDNKLAAAKKLDPDIVSKQLFDFIKSVADYLVEMNKKQINEDSQDIYGDAIGFYSKATEIISKGSKKAGEPFDGDDTGDWLSKFYMTINDNIFFFGSSDPKTEDILNSDNWLSQDLFGLTEENLQLAIDTKFKPFIIDYYRKQLTA